MTRSGYTHEIPQNHMASVKRDCSWGLFRRVEIDKRDGEGAVPVTLHYDPVTGSRIKASELPEGWQCSYEDAVKALETSGGYYDGIAFLITDEDPYHVTIIKGGEWALEAPRRLSPGHPDALYYAQLTTETEEVLDQQTTYAFEAPFGSDIYVIGKAKRPRESVRSLVTDSSPK